MACCWDCDNAFDSVVKTALFTMGARSNIGIANGDSFAFLGTKGATIGTAIEVLTLFH